MIDYNTIRTGDTLYPDEDLRALIYARYGEYASKSYHVLSRGTLQGRTVKTVKVTRIVLDDGTEMEEKWDSYEEHEWAKPLLLTHGDGQNKKASLDWDEIRRFKPTARLKEKATPPIRKSKRGNLIIPKESLNTKKAKDILASLGLDSSVIVD